MNNAVSQPIAATQPTSEEDEQTQIAIIAARLRPRAYALGLLCLILNQFWLIEVELVRWSLFTNVVPFCNAIFTLAALLLLNGLAARFLPARRPPLTRAELLCVFLMICIGSALGAQQMMQLLVAALVYPARYAGYGNHWKETFVPYLPQWAMVTDPTSVSNFYVGNSSFYRPENFRPWLIPILFWCSFTLALLWTMLCINTLLRRRWTAAERLSYPTVFLPIEMTSGPAFWQNRLLWLGFAFAGGVTLWNGFAYLFPSLPMIPIRRQQIQDALFPNPPWNGIGSLQTSFYFFAIGIAFLMPQDLSFSLWCFYLLYKLELVFITAMGWGDVATSGAGFGNQPPYDSGQAFGAYAAVFVMTLWAMRAYLKDVWRTAFGSGPKPLDDSAEPMRYRTALLGSLFGVLVLSAFCMALGMSAWVAVAFFLLYFVLAVMITRIRAEFGFPVHDLHNVGPMNPLLAAFGPRALGPRTLAAFSQTFWFNRTYFPNPMPHQLEGMKLADVSGARQRDFVKAILLAGLVGAVGAFWTYLHTIYQRGAATAHVEFWPLTFPLENYSRVHSWFTLQTTPNPQSLQAAAGGFVFAFTLGSLRQRFAWFPFHPLAYAVANSWGMTQLWMPIFIGSVCKIVILRFGGLSLYRRAVPFFLGLILGEMIVGGLWTLYGIQAGVRAYDFWP